MLYFLISFILFFTSAQSNDIIDAYYSAFTGEFQNTPESILELTQRLSLGSLYDIKYYKNIPQKLIELGFFLPGNIASFENLLSELLTLADQCYHGEISFPSISKISPDNIEVHIENLRNLINKKYEFYKKLNAFYDNLRHYFLENHITLGVNTLPKTPEEINQAFMIFLIQNNLNPLTPHNLPNNYGTILLRSKSSLPMKYVSLLLNIKDKNRIIELILNTLKPLILNDTLDLVYDKLDAIFQARNYFLHFPVNANTNSLDQAMEDYFKTLAAILNMEPQVMNLFVYNHKTHFPDFSQPKL
jgi:hypothetical protein